MSKATVLIVEDEHALASALGASVTRLGATPKYAASGSKALAALSGTRPDAVVLDIGLPDLNGLEVLRRAFPGGLELPVLVLTAHGNLENAIAAKRLGVAEYLTKPLDLHAFEGVLGGLLSTPAKPAAGEVTGSGTATMVGATPLMQRVFREVAHACTTDVPVIIGGASGTGKTLAARVIHSNGDGGGELVTVECGDADGGKIDEVFSDAGPATGVLLENVDRLSETGQAALLAAVEAGTEARLFSTARSPLHEAVEAGEFRDDLYYRLRGTEIRLPALRERRGDIPALAAHFVALETSGGALEISEEALAILSSRRWRGNLRELADAVAYAVSVCGGARLLPVHLPDDPNPGAAGGGGLDEVIARWLDERLTLEAKPPVYVDLLDELEAVVLRNLLARHGGKPTVLAAEMAINRTTLRKRLERLGIS